MVQVGERVTFTLFHADPAKTDGKEEPPVRVNGVVVKAGRKGARAAGEKRPADVVAVRADGRCDLRVLVSPRDVGAQFGPHARIDAVTLAACDVAEGTGANTFQRVAPEKK